MDNSLLVASPFLQDPLDFHSPSPQSNQFDISPNEGPYDSFDYQPEASSHFPHTPSYNGSYQNSPYSVLSDLPPTFDGNDTLGLYPNDLSAPAIPEEYDPSDFDVPTSSANNVLSFGDSYMPSLGNNPQVSVTPADYNDSAFDHSSPASSNGQEEGRRSRASSTSSYMHSGSPHLDLPQNLANLTFDSPNWQSVQLPQARQPSPPSHKAPSPPQLVIPSSPSVTANDSPPTINAPDGDGVMNSGPQLHIVPATPISGGGGTVGNVPFQTTLANLHQQGAYCIVVIFFHLRHSSFMFHFICYLLCSCFNFTCFPSCFGPTQADLGQNGIPPGSISPRKVKIKICTRSSPISERSITIRDLIATNNKVRRGWPLLQVNHRCTTSLTATGR